MDRVKNVMVNTGLLKQEMVIRVCFSGRIRKDEPGAPWREVSGEFQVNDYVIKDED